MKNLKECLFYEKKEEGKVRCTLCPHYCLIKNGGIGFCNARYNDSGVLYSKNYGIISSCGVDPIEKKPLWRFFPGSKILSIGSFGCNLKCAYCQNYSISQDCREGVYAAPEDIVDMAKNLSENIGIAFTYNEPAIWYEFVLDTAKLNKQTGRKNVLVTNGYINKEPLEKLLPYIDAMNIDLKGFDDSFYQEMCRGRLQPVLDTILLCAGHCHIEITTLVVTDKIDNMQTIEAIAQWISKIDQKIPLHLSRYFPNYHYDRAPTDIEFMKKAKNIGEKYLKYVYLGNI